MIYYREENVPLICGGVLSKSIYVLRREKMDLLIWFVPAVAVVALLFALYLTQKIKRQEAGTEKMKEIAGAIKEGAQAF